MTVDNLNSQLGPRSSPVDNRRFDSYNKIARSEQSSYTPGSSHQRLSHFQRKDKIVKYFIILNQVVSEKTLMKNVHKCYIRVTEGKLKI